MTNEENERPKLEILKARGRSETEINKVRGKKEVKPFQGENSRAGFA